MFKLALICGGNSDERGVSLNSVRSVFDNISDENIEITIIYFDKNLHPYKISGTFLYSNTPSDFDFKLDFEQNYVAKLTINEFIQEMEKIDLAFPIIHGYFGEDGRIQHLLEKNSIPFIGSNSQTCQQVYNKIRSKKFLKKNNFFEIKQIGINKNDSKSENIKKIQTFLNTNNLKKVIVKPAESGSSFHIYTAENLDEITNALAKIFASYFQEAVIEEFCNGTEFTTIVLEHKNQPVALIPLEVEVDGIFTYGKKYTPSHDAHYYCPPRFPDDAIKKIMNQAEKLFKDCGAKDFIRIDGWMLKNGEIYFSDYNPISGMEQNSFLFQAASRIGLSHKAILEYIIQNACQKYGLTFPKNSSKIKTKKNRVNVLFGGTTSERDVSIMSGTNAWLKLMKSNKYESFAYFLEDESTVWAIPYSIALSHNTTEISRQCQLGKKYITALNNFGHEIRNKLEIPENSEETKKILNFPRKMTLDDFISECKSQNAYVFLGVHGGIGENGKIQKKLENAKLNYNGSDSKASALCMDKLKTGEIINNSNLESIRSSQKISFNINDFMGFKQKNFDEYWKNIIKRIYHNISNEHSLIVKPRFDGSSSGVVKLNSGKDLKNYIDILNNSQNLGKISDTTFRIPQNKKQEFLFEEFIETDKIFIKNKKISRKIKTGWTELTVGVLEKNGKYHAFQPSVTIAEGNILSLEEKFQGGTGVNITPPDKSIIPEPIEATKIIQKSIELISNILEIKNYARIDIFYNCITKKIIVIEANTLPALTPSTVIFQQAIKDNLTPKNFLEKIIENSTKS